MNNENKDEAYNKLLEMYINDTIVSGQKFCGCTPYDCSSYDNMEQCKICLDKEIIKKVEKRQLKLWFFKTSGKWYIGETIEVPKHLKVYEVCDYVRTNIHMHAGMHCVIPFDNCDDINGYPCMIPADERETEKIEREDVIETVEE